MVTWFCPACFATVAQALKRCPACGADLAALDAEDMDHKLLRALDHPLPDRRVLAARALGIRRTTEAVGRLVSIAEGDADPYVAAAAVTALAAIGGDAAGVVVRRIANSGPAIPRAAARKALAGR